MYKEILRSIDNIETMPLISLVFFFLFFLGMFIWVVTVDKKYVEHMKSLPFNGKNENGSDYENK